MGPLHPLTDYDRGVLYRGQRRTQLKFSVKISMPQDYDGWATVDLDILTDFAGVQAHRAS